MTHLREAIWEYLLKLNYRGNMRSEVCHCTQLVKSCNIFTYTKTNRTKTDACVLKIIALRDIITACWKLVLVHYLQEKYMMTAKFCCSFGLEQLKSCNSESKFPAVRVVAKAKTQGWNKFGGTIEKDYWSASERFWQLLPLSNSLRWHLGWVRSALSTLGL